MVFYIDLQFCSLNCFVLLCLCPAYLTTMMHTYVVTRISILALCVYMCMAPVTSSPNTSARRAMTPPFGENEERGLQDDDSSQLEARVLAERRLRGKRDYELEASRRFDLDDSSQEARVLAERRLRGKRDYELEASRRFDLDDSSQEARVLAERRLRGKRDYELEAPRGLDLDDSSQEARVLAERRLRGKRDYELEASRRFDLDDYTKRVAPPVTG
ncbi:hypothetical protein HOLleu_20888 [Holothuria leucospilota]|uniref:Uncharacterized protein n=1 Tax=Holothuria leucospilota TaxID=206669 RepID=A0A9Q1BX08_HOLLE|nr:hypothetical protein HOLleu_20888 [Holothuria leucospilota]